MLRQVKALGCFDSRRAACPGPDAAVPAREYSERESCFTERVSVHSECLYIVREGEGTMIQQLSSEEGTP